MRIGLDATVMVPEKSASPRNRRPFSPFGGSLFDDPFFDDFFDNAFTRLVPREVTLTSDGDPLDIRSLPREGRPEHFSGAVGEFSLGAYRLPADAHTGEPRKIRVTVEGRGNFDRMSAPVLEPADHWKTYTPKTEFRPGDATSFSGAKTFEFSAVPLKGGKQDVRLAFDYFDPSAGTYQNLETPAIPLEIAGEDVVPLASNGAPAGGSGMPDAAEGASPVPVELAPPRLTLGSGLPLLISPSVQPRFWTLAAVFSGLIVLGFVIRAVQRRRSDPQRRAARRSVVQEHEALSRVENSVRNGNAAAFFAAARHALQVRFVAAWNRPAESITVAELRQRLPDNSAALALFRQADALAYAPAPATTGFDAERWHALLQRALKEADDQ